MDEPLLTLGDVAELAQVRRPVVSMWRKRANAANGVVPFPDPVARSDGIERFARGDVTEYLRQTGRGNNRDFDTDAAAVSPPEDVDLEDLVNLLCLRVCLGVDLVGSTKADRARAARRTDPSSSFMVLDDTPPVADQYVDALFDASTGPADALRRLERGRAGRRARANSFTQEVLDLLEVVLASCADDIAESGGVATLIIDAPAFDARFGRDFRSVRVVGDGPEAEGARCRLFLHDIAQLAPDESMGSAVSLRSLVGHDVPGVLAAVDEAVLELRPGNSCVVVGPAAALVDGLTAQAETDRAATLRAKFLACALRLPRGYRRDAQRQALSIWVLVGGAEISYPMVADLEAFNSSDLDLGDLGSDVAACLATSVRGGDPIVAAGIRAFRYLRRVNLVDILGGQPVVSRGARVVSTRVAERNHRDRVIEQALITSVPAPTFDVDVADADAATIAGPSSLGQLIGSGLTVHRGSRIDLDGHADGTLAVWTANGPTGVTYDPLEAERRYPRARRTAPGDVIFAAKPRPCAVVDARGGSLVASPSRILRAVEGGGLAPYTLAALINLLPEGLGDWQAWPMPRLRPEQAEQLESVLRGAAKYEDELRARLAATKNLQQELIAGVASGAITVVNHSKEND